MKSDNTSPTTARGKAQVTGCSNPVGFVPSFLLFFMLSANTKTQAMPNFHCERPKCLLFSHSRDANNLYSLLWPELRFVFLVSFLTLLSHLLLSFAYPCLHSSKTRSRLGSRVGPGSALVGRQGRNWRTTNRPANHIAPAHGWVIGMGLG